MLIIVEGPPSSGKSTLAHKLKTTLSQKHGPDSVTVLNGHANGGSRLCGERYARHFLQRLEDYVPGGDEHIICDEWHWGHPVFQQIFSPSTYVQPAVVSYVDLRLSQLGAVIVHRNPTEEVLARRLSQHNPFTQPHPRILRSLTEIKSEYYALSRRAVSTLMPPNSSPASIMQSAEYWEKKAIPLATQYPWYLGPPNPQAVLVELNYQSTDTLFPKNHSGEFFLHHALISASPDPSPFRTFGLLNAAFCTPESFADLMRDLQVPKILALGSKVSQYLTDVKHTVLPNPGSTRIKHNAYMHEYGELIHSALTLPQGADTDLSGWCPPS